MYYQKQDYLANCVLLSSAMAIGMATGDMPSPETMIELAKTNQRWSIRVERCISTSRQLRRLGQGCRGADGAVFRRHRRQHALRTYDEAGTRIRGRRRRDGQLALGDLQAALAVGSAVTVSINTNIVWSAAGNYNLRRLTSPRAVMTQRWCRWT